MIAIPVAIFIVIMPSPKFQPKSTEGSISNKSNKNLIYFIALLFLFIGGAEAATGHWIAKHLQIAGKDTGLLYTGAGIGGMTFPLLIGQLFNRVGENVVLYIILCCFTTSLIMFLLLTRKISKHANVA